MIGQKNLIYQIKTLIDEETFPQFSIFIGAKGSGRKTLMREIAKLMLDYQVHELEDVKIDTIREMIEEANRKARAGAKIVYIIPNAEDMSLPAKNSILKITEEPPKGAIFLMSVANEEDLLDTIKNRAALFRMRPYSQEEKQQYLDSLQARLLHDDEQLILRTANTLSDVEKLVKMNPGAFKDYVDKLITMLISEESPAKLLTQAKNVAFKEDSEGYDLELLWRLCCVRLAEQTFNKIDGKESLVYAKLIARTIESMGELRSTTVSREKTFDMWILNCRKIVKKWKSEN